jgi:hypothetical protein
MRPKSSAPRLIRLAETPSSRIARNAMRSESGITDAVSRDARNVRRNRNRIAVTRRPPSIRFRKTVCVVRATTSPWL